MVITMALSFDGSKFVAIDDDAFGDGSGDLTQPLDAACEACLHANHAKLFEGINVATWTPYTTDSDTGAPSDKVRPYASVDWMTVGPLWRIPFMPGDKGLELEMGYRVRDFGDGSTTNTLAYWTRATVPGFGTTVTQHASTDWSTTRIQIAFNFEVERPLWLPVRIFGRSEIYESAPLISKSSGGPRIRDTMVSTIYSDGNKSNEPNATTPDIQATLAVSNGLEAWHDHVIYDTTSVITQKGMVLNPGIDPGASYNVEVHALSFIQIHGIALRIYQEPVIT